MKASVVVPGTLVFILLITAVRVFFPKLGWGAATSGPHSTPSEPAPAFAPAHVAQQEEAGVPTPDNQPAPPARSDTDTDSYSTKWKCHLRGPWSDLCNYENVCFSSLGQLVFVNDDTEAYASATAAAEKVGMKMSTKLPLHEPQPGRVFPVHYSGSSFTTITRAELAARQVTWSASSSSPDGALYVLSYQDALSNIWYYSTRVLPLFTADLHAEELGLPRIAEVLLPAWRADVTNNWHVNVLKLALSESDIPVHYRDDAPYFGLARKEPSDTSLVCAKRAVLLGANVYGFTDMVSAHAFRAKAWASVGLPLPPMQAPTDTSTIPRNVTVLDRPRAIPRHITNKAATLDVVRKYGYEPNWVTNEGTSFAEQVRLMASTGLLVTVHGAGLMNQIFMPPGAVTIEIFPNHMKHVLYERVAHYVGVYHFKVYSTEHPADRVAKHPKYDELGCDNVRGLEIPNRQLCWAIVKNLVVVVPLRQFEVALVDALDFIDRTTLKE